VLTLLRFGDSLGDRHRSSLSNVRRGVDAVVARTRTVLFGLLIVVVGAGVGDADVINIRHLDVSEGGRVSVVAVDAWSSVSAGIT